MSRIFLIGAASLAALTAAAGTVSIMAIDLLGASFIEKIKFIGEHPRDDGNVPKELKGTKDITYFKTVKVDGKPFSITMGISFATPEDLASGKQKSRWCYTMIKPADGGVPRQIELATQEGAKPPRYNDLAAYGRLNWPFSARRWSRWRRSPASIASSRRSRAVRARSSAASRRSF